MRWFTRRNRPAAQTRPTQQNFFSTVMFQPVNRVRNAISSGQNVRQTREDGMTPLHLAAIWDRLDVAQLLLDNGADINAVDDQGQTPYDVAVSQETKHFLESQGASINTTNNNNRTNPQLYENWNQYEREHNINAETNNNNNSNTEYVWNTSSNFNEDPSPYENTTRPHTSAGNNPTRPFNLNANYNIITPPVYNNSRNTSAKDPITYKNNSKGKSFFRRIIGGAQIESEFIKAVQTGKIEKARIYLNNGVSPDTKDQYGHPLLYWAILQKDVDMLDLLLDAGANPNIKGVGQRTPLQIVAKMNTRGYNGSRDKIEEIIEVLIAYGADPNMLNIDGLTAMNRTKNNHIRTVLGRHTRKPSRKPSSLNGVTVAKNNTVKSVTPVKSVLKQTKNLVVKKNNSTRKNKNNLYMNNIYKILERNIEETNRPASPIAYNQSLNKVFTITTVKKKGKK